MPPVIVSASRLTSSLESGEAKLWALLVGVNHYEDESLPPLRYASLDCQGVREALVEATHAFPKKEFLSHHDLSSASPDLESVTASLKQIVAAAQPKDTVLMYFSGHGVLDPETQETVLCVRDTHKERLLQTGFRLQEMLLELSRCKAHSQLIWLDACHSGNISLSGARGPEAEKPVLNATHQLLEVLRQRAAKSRGFYALLSCDEGQQSWEFPDLGHGVFSYYLMRGLRGEAAGNYGVIDADSLYRYVYHHTLQYIEQTNQQLRLVNQQKRTKGEAALYPEYSLQTPKRIVEGVGEIILGLKPTAVMSWQERYALLVTGDVQGGDPSLCQALSEVLTKEGQFDVSYFSNLGEDVCWDGLRGAISTFLQQENAVPLVSGGSALQSLIQTVATRLLYLRGQVEIGYDGEAWLCLDQGLKLSRSWLRQELRRARNAQQIVVLDFPNTADLDDWLEELKISSEHGQCIIACSSPADDPDLFAQVLLNTLVSAKPNVGLAIANLLAKLQTNLEGLGISCQMWLSGAQGLIEIIPASALVVDVEPEKIETKPETLSTSLLTSSAVTAQTISGEVTLEDLAAIDHAASYQQLETTLLELVGPITPVLLLQAAAKERMNQLPQVVQELSFLIPPQHREQFEQRTRSWVNPPAVSTSAVQLSEITSQPTVPAPVLNGGRIADPVLPLQAMVGSSNIWSGPLSSDLYQQVEQVLREQIGPITSMLLSQVPSTTTTLQELFQLLSDHLPEEKLSALTKQLEQQLKAPSNLPSSDYRSSRAQASSPFNAFDNASGRGVSSGFGQRVVDDVFIQKCESELVLLIGPIGKFIVNNHRGRSAQQSLNDFVESLALEIPNERQANEFRQRVLQN